MSLARGMTLPAREVALKFGAVLHNLPTPPLRFGHHALVREWGMLKNDTTGDCVPVGHDHALMLLNAMGGKRVEFTDTPCLADYYAMNGNLPWPFNDQGTDIEVAASYWRKTGMHDVNGVRHRIDAYAELPLSADVLLRAVYLLGMAGVGLTLPDDAEQQFSEAVPWSDTSQPPGSGHFVIAVGRNGAGNILVVTWGRLHAMTPAYFAKYSPISLAYLSREQLDGRGLSPDQYNAGALRGFIAGLGPVNT